MSNVVIPKEQLSAYERWEMSSIGHGHNGSASKAAPARDNKPSELTEKLAQLTEKARQEGYAIGLQQGYAEGNQQARQEHGVNQEAITHIANSMQAALEVNQEEISHDLLRLALDIAKSMLKSSIEVNREVVIPVVLDAMQALPYVQKPAKIIVNPDDAAIIRQELAEEIKGTWQVVENMEIERGGCRLETGANQVDATNAVRWKRINEALGQNSDWISINGARHE